MDYNYKKNKINKKNNIFNLKKTKNKWDSNRRIKYCLFLRYKIRRNSDKSNFSSNFL